MKEEKDKFIILRASKKDIEKLNDLKEYMDKSKSEILREYINETHKNIYGDD